jgi:hypothetical protein
LEIRNLVDFNSHIFIKEPVEVLDTVKPLQIKCTQKLSAGNYIARITLGPVSSIKDFQIEE